MEQSLFGCACAVHPPCPCPYNGTDHGVGPYFGDKTQQTIFNLKHFKTLTFAYELLPLGFDHRGIGLKVSWLLRKTLSDNKMSPIYLSTLELNLLYTFLKFLQRSSAFPTLHLINGSTRRDTTAYVS